MTEPLKPTLKNPFGAAPTGAGPGALAPVDFPRAGAWGSMAALAVQILVMVLQWVGANPAFLVFLPPPWPAVVAFVAASLLKLVTAFYGDESVGKTNNV
jgi:hypothetical protein